jgi:hypothetical protein
LLALGAVPLPPAGAQPPGPDAELTRILDLMEQRQKQAGIIRIKAEGERFMPKGGRSEFFGPGVLSEPVAPPRDERTELRQDYTFDFAGQRYRRQSSERLGTRFDSSVQVYDGKKTYGVKPDLPIEQLDLDFRPTYLSVAIGLPRLNIFNFEDWAYLMSAGFIISADRRPYFKNEFALPLDRDNLFVHGQATADGVACVVLRTYPSGPKGNEEFREFAVGRSDGAVRRCTHWLPGPRKYGEVRIRYRAYGERLGPASWTTEWLQKSDPTRAWKSEAMKVVLFEAGDALAERFTLAPAAGADIEETKYPETERAGDETVARYKADDSGNWVQGEVIAGESKPNRTWVWWVGGGVVLSIVLGLLSRRLFRRRSPDGPASSPTGGST